MQFQTDADLNEALSKPQVTILPLLEVDWSRDGLYGHAYSNMSKLVASVNVDFASIHGDIPADINTIVGSSSGLMKVVLSGRRVNHEMRASQLWSEYWAPSPLFSTNKRGVPIRYSRNVRTRAGFKTIRQFTGWVSEVIIDEDNDTVELTCSDIYDLQNKVVTLPVWARGPEPTVDSPAGYFGYSPMAPIDVCWVYGETLRQAGRSLWPNPRSDAAVMWSLSGSLLPSVGTMADATNSKHSRSMYGLLGQLGKYGPATFDTSAGIDNDDINTCQCRAAKYIGVPDRGSSDTPAYIGLSAWVYSNGTGVYNAAKENIFGTILGASLEDSGYVQLHNDIGGSFKFTIRESASSGSTIAGSVRTWQYRTGATFMPTGWHYINVIASFTNASVTVAAYMDGVLQSPTVLPSNPTVAYKYYHNLAYFEPTNFCYAQIKCGSIQHAQIYSGGGGVVLNSTDQHPDYINKGQIQPARISMFTNRLACIPNTDTEIAWDVLRAAVGGELGAMFTREDGQLWIMGRDDVYASGITPALYGNDPAGLLGGFLGGSVGTELLNTLFYISNPDVTTSTVDDLSRARLSGVSYNPSADTYRNRVTYEIPDVRQIPAIVWNSDSPTRFLAASGSVGITQDIILPADVVSIRPIINATTAVASPTVPVLNATTVSAIDATNVNNPAAFGWSIGVEYELTQRWFRLNYGAGLLSPGPVYIGSLLGAQQANFAMGGYKYDMGETQSYGWKRQDEITAKGGEFVLDLGSNPWRTYKDATDLIAQSVLRDTVNAAPIIKNLSVPVDPRRQLLDVIKMPPSKIVSGDIYAQVLGKSISDTQSTHSDEIDVRVINTGGPVTDLYWGVAGRGWGDGHWT